MRSSCEERLCRSGARLDGGSASKQLQQSALQSLLIRLPGALNSRLHIAHCTSCGCGCRFHAHSELGRRAGRVLRESAAPEFLHG
jgi:hypothetical protein